MRRESGVPMPSAERYDVDRAERRLREAIGELAFTEAFRVGADADVNRLVAAVESLATTAA